MPGSFPFPTTGVREVLREPAGQMGAIYGNRAPRGEKPDWPLPPPRNLRFRSTTAVST